MSLLCYLCGETIESGVSDDHVPPQQFFARAVRQQVNLDNLTTLPTHESCNSAYSLDEEYATTVLALAAERSATAVPILEGLHAKLAAGRSLGLGYRLLSQLSDRPSGLHLPGGMARMKIEGDRVGRVLWKIVRGLYWLEHTSFLPAETPRTIEIFEPMASERPQHPEVWDAVKSQRSRGIYQAVFDFKYLHARAGSAEFHAWGLLLWDSVMVFVGHHPVEACVTDELRSDS